MVYGTWRLLETKPTAQEINRRLHACLELGITTIDTAEIYGLYEVEQVLGAALALSPGLPGRLTLATISCLCNILRYPACKYCEPRSE